MYMSVKMRTSARSLHSIEAYDHGVADLARSDTDKVSTTSSDEQRVFLKVYSSRLLRFLVSRARNTLLVAYRFIVDEFASRSEVHIKKELLQGPNNKLREAPLEGRSSRVSRHFECMKGIQSSSVEHAYLYVCGSKKVRLQWPARTR